MNSKNITLILIYAFHFVIFSICSFIMVNNIPKEAVEPLKMPKQHKFHYGEIVNIIDGFNKGSSGKIISYNERNDKYQIYLGTMDYCLVRDSEIKLKNKEDQLVDFFSDFTNEELMEIALRKEQEVIGLSGVTMEKIKRQDAKAAKEELSRRGISIVSTLDD